MSETPLNKAQKEALEYTAGPLIIIAGAGTGKTTVITEKIAYLVKGGFAKPEEILALTFTDKAAGEMAERVDRLIDIGYADLEISTFHSFCQKLLERYGLNIGINNEFKLLAETDAWLLVRKNLEKFNLDYYRPLGNPSGHIHALISHFQKCKDELITAKEYLEYAEELHLDKDVEQEKSRLLEVASAYHSYNQLLLDNKYLDFADLIFYSIQLLKQRPNTLEFLRKKYKFILIDEFQDVNWAQYQLVRMLCGDGCQLAVVGDDDQSIYAFRGSSVSNILRFKDDYPQAKEILLLENYRSGQEILDYAYKLIQNNNPDRLEVKLDLKKRLISARNQDSAVEHIYCSTLTNEVFAVISRIRELRETDKDAVWDDFAILVRANNHAEPFITALEKAGMPYEFLASSGLFRQPLVLDCMSFLKLTDNYHESGAVYRMLNLPVWKFSDDDLQKLTHNAHKKSLSFYELLKRAGEFGVSSEGAEIAGKILKLISAGMQNARGDKPTTVLYKFLEQSGLLRYLTDEENVGNAEVIRQIYQLNQFFEFVNKFETENPAGRVAELLQHFSYISEAGDLGQLYQPKDTPDSINIITIHKAKGLEFKYVFVVNLVEDRFPARNRGELIEIPGALIKEQLPEGDAHLQEERRLFYVAITRAKSKLFLLNADDYGGARNKKHSRFLSELGFGNGNAPQGQKLEKTAYTEREKEKSSVYEVPAVFSYSQIKAYATCPYQYKLSHVLKIPTRGSASFSFGRALHLTLQKFYSKMQEINRVFQNSLFGASAFAAGKEARVPSRDELLDMYERSWVDDWYSSALQKEEYRNLGIKILKNFYSANENKWTIPASLEGWFKIKIGDYHLRGRMDRVDCLGDGTIEIIDYKTGTPKEKLALDDKDQLLIYQIAAQELAEFQSLGKLSKLTYYYLNDGSKLSFLGTGEETAKLTDKISETILKIKSLDFTPKPNSRSCGFCDFKDICQYKEL